MEQKAFRNRRDLGFDLYYWWLRSVISYQSRYRRYFNAGSVTKQFGFVIKGDIAYKCGALLACVI